MNPNPKLKGAWFGSLLHKLERPSKLAVLIWYRLNGTQLWGQSKDVRKEILLRAHDPAYCYDLLHSLEEARSFNASPKVSNFELTLPHTGAWHFGDLFGEGNAQMLPWMTQLLPNSESSFILWQTKEVWMMQLNVWIDYCQIQVSIWIFLLTECFQMMVSWRPARSFPPHRWCATCRATKKHWENMFRGAFSSVQQLIIQLFKTMNTKTRVCLRKLI